MLVGNEILCEIGPILYRILKGMQYLVAGLAWNARFSELLFGINIRKECYQNLNSLFTLPLSS